MFVSVTFFFWIGEGWGVGVVSEDLVLSVVGLMVSPAGG